MAVRASTTASLSARSLEPSSGSIPSGAPGSLSQPAAHPDEQLRRQNIEQQRQHGAAKMLGVLALDVALQVLDLLVLEEVKRRVEVVDRPEPRALGGRLLLDVAPHLGGRRGRDRG